MCGINVAHSSIENLYTSKDNNYYVVHKYKVEFVSDAVHERHAERHSQHACTCCCVYIWFSIDATMLLVIMETIKCTCVPSFISIYVLLLASLRSEEVILKNST